MPKRYALPLALSELTSWYADGIADIHAYRFISLDEQGEATQDLRSYAARSLPGYTDDFEVLYAVVDVEHPFDAQELQGEQDFPLLLEIPFERVTHVRASTERGRSMLPSRVPPGVVVEGTLFGEEGAAEDARRARRKARRGGEALLTVAGLGPYSDAAIEREPDVWRALKLRDQQVGFPVEGGTFVDNLLNYDRRDPKYPRSSLGYVYDYGKIAISYGADSSDELWEALKAMRGELDSLVGRGETDVWTNYEVLRPHFERLVGLIDQGYSPAACITFLQVQEDVRSSGRLGDSLDWVVRSMRSLDLQAEVAHGLYLAGSFFGFATFAEEYYAEVRASLHRNADRDRVRNQKTETEKVDNGDRSAEPPRDSQVPALGLFNGDEEQTEGVTKSEALNETEKEDLAPDILAPREFSGPGYQALLEEDVEVLADMLCAAIKSEGGQLSREDAEKAVTRVFATRRRPDDVLPRLSEALDLACDRGMLIVEGEDLMLKEGAQSYSG